MLVVSLVVSIYLVWAVLEDKKDTHKFSCQENGCPLLSFCDLLLTLLGGIHPACSGNHASGTIRGHIFVYVFMPGTYMFPELLKEWVTC